jgi:Protein of unknown function, DUF547
LKHRNEWIFLGTGIAMVLLTLWLAQVARCGVPGTDPPSLGTQANGQPDRLPSLDVSDYDRLLHTYVTDEGWVDYAGLARDRDSLNGFLEKIAVASPRQFANDSERLAFWIDAYNALTLSDVLDSVYGKHGSVREVDGFFNGKRHSVAGEQLTLDEVEKRGRDLHDPRIHFALVCASTSCPKLQRFAYTGSELNTQLDLAAKEFLGDPNRGLYLDQKHNELIVSPIFKWYAGDFVGTTSSTGQLWARVKAAVSGTELLDFIARYSSADVARFIQQNGPALHYKDYDWSLNSLDTHSAARRSTK